MSIAKKNGNLNVKGNYITKNNKLSKNIAIYLVLIHFLIRNSLCNCVKQTVLFYFYFCLNINQQLFIDIKRTCTRATVISVQPFIRRLAPSLSAPANRIYRINSGTTARNIFFKENSESIKIFEAPFC